MNPAPKSSTGAKKPAAKKPAAKKTTAAKSTAKKPAAKRATTRKPAAKKGTARKSAARKPSASTARARAAGAGAAARRWSAQEIALLKETVENSRTAKEAFAQVAQQIGKSTGTVQQKWYAMQRAAGKGRTARRARSGAKRVASTAQATTAKAQATASKQWTSLKELDVDDLVSLISSAQTEFERRRKAFEAAARRLRG
jgi:hypothetical protein